MFHWQRWWWGLVPLLLVYFLMLRWTATPITQDIQTRVQNAIAKDYTWASVKQDVRDLTLSGSAPSPEEQASVAKYVSNLWGVRVLKDTIALAPEQKPYSFIIKKDDAGVTLSGFVQNATIQNSLLAKATELFGSLKVTNALQIARGGGDANAWAEKAIYAMSQAKALATGEVSIKDELLSLSGKIADASQLESLKAVLQKLPAGLKLGANSLEPAIIQPYTAKIKLENDQITLSGYAPTEQAATNAVTTLSALGKISGGFTLGNGLLENIDYDALIKHAAAALGEVKSGTWNLSGNIISFTGDVKSSEGYEKLQKVLAQVPANTKLENAKVEAVVQKPYKLSIKRDETGLTISGYYPDEQTLMSFLSKLRQSFGDIAIANNLQIGGGEPAGFYDLAGKSLVQLERLAQGELNIQDQSLTLNGSAYLESASQEIPRALNAILPLGFTVQAQITKIEKVAQISSGECQKMLSDALNGRTIQFETGKADISVLSKGLLEQLAATAMRCPTTNLEIIGHTDNVGVEDNNLILSYNRAMTVVKYLVETGIDIKRLAAIGYGSMKPIASNDNEQGKAKNRRIEFVVKP